MFSSMLPLLIKDGQLVPYVAFMFLYPALFYAFYPVCREQVDGTATQKWCNIFTNLAVCASFTSYMIEKI